MAKQKLTYTFVAPNRPEDLEKVLRSILVEKLRAAREAGKGHDES